MTILQNKKLIIIFAIILIILAVLILFFINPVKKYGTYEEATRNCGNNPVIGADLGEPIGPTYFVPSDENNELLSEYDKNNPPLSRYPDEKYFCTVDEAKAAGYESHECCGLLPLKQ